MTTKPEDYPWSSYRHYAYGERNPLLTDDIFYETLGQTQEDRQENYANLMVDQAITEYMDKNDTDAVGDKHFVYNVNRKVRYHEINRNAPYRKTGS